MTRTMSLDTFWETHIYKPKKFKKVARRSGDAPFLVGVYEVLQGCKIAFLV